MRALAVLAGYDRLADIDDPRFASLYVPGGGMVPESLRTFFAAYDRAYLFTAYPEPDILVRRVASGGVKRCQVLDPRPEAGSHGHIIPHLMDILDSEEVTYSEPTMPEMVPPLLGHLRTGTGSGILIHPGSGGREKIWPLDRFLDLAGRIEEAVTFVLGPAECERGMDRKFRDAACRFVAPGSIAELARIVGAARLFVGNDSGAGHLAAMTGTPAVILYGPTDPRVWRPVGNRVETVVSPDGTMTGIHAGDVLRAVEVSG